MKVKLTPTQSEWQKQIKRLQRIIRTEERKGLNIPAGIIPEQPKRVTKQKIEQLRSIKPATIRAVLEEQKLGTKPSTPVDLLGRVRVKHEEEYIRHPRIRKAEEPYQPHPLTPEQRSEIARKAMATRMARGYKPSFPAMTPEQRSANAKKAMQTRMARGYKPTFPTFTPEQRSSMAKKAWETRKARGEVPKPPKPKEPQEPKPSKESSSPSPKPKHELPPPRKEHPDSAPAIEDTWVEIMDSIINNIDYPSLREYYHNLIRDVYNSADDDTLANIINQEAYMVDKVSRINYESAVDDKLDASIALYYVITGEQASTEIYTRMRDDIKYDMTMLGEYITHT